MKNPLPIIATLICLALGAATGRAAVVYWDSNGTNYGAGDTPVGTWDSDIFWSTNSFGTNDTAAWVDGDTAVFSAGADATNAYSVNIVGAPNPASIIFEDGVPTLAGGTIFMTNDFEFPIVANTNATISATLADLGGSPGCGIYKTGPGKLTLTAANAFGGTNIIAEGTIAYLLNTSLGSSSVTPTIVSNGASLLQAAAVDITESVILNGMGVSNSGALVASSAPSAGTQGWRAGAVLDSDARINWNGGGQWTWLTSPITNNGNNCNVYFGGSGGTLRLNIGFRAVQLGTGSVYKDGATTLQVETPFLCNAIYFNGGNLLCRVGGGFMSGAGPIYCGPSSGQFRTGSGGPSWAMVSPVIVTNGSNPAFAPTATFTISCNAPISGPGGITKATAGSTVNLNAANTYSNSTTITGGTLALGAAGSISNSSAIDVQSGAVFNVSAVSGGFVLGPAQTLKGNGSVQGDVTAYGAIAPGASIGNLTFNNNLTLGAGAQLAIEVNKSLSPSNDVITVLGTILTNTGSGTVVVQNLGPALTAGDSFQILSQPLSNSLALSVVSLGGVVWTNKLGVDGSIRVVSVTPVAATNLTIVRFGPASFKVSGKGAANSSYGIYAATNLAPPAIWSLIGITNSSPSGVIEFVDVQPSNRQKFYRFGQ